MPPALVVSDAKGRNKSPHVKRLLVFYRGVTTTTDSPGIWIVRRSTQPQNNNESKRSQKIYPISLKIVMPTATWRITFDDRDPKAGQTDGLTDRLSNCPASFFHKQFHKLDFNNDNSID